MVKRMATTTTQRKLGKVRRARAVVMVLLVLVALAIVLVDKKREEQPIELSQSDLQPSADKASVVTTGDSIYSVPSLTSIAQNMDSSKANLAKNSPVTIVSPQLQSPVVSRSDVSPKNADVSKTPVAEKTDTLPEYHLVAPGDTLSGIAGKYYGKTSLWQEIFKANQDVLRSPGSLKVGQKLKVPPHKVVSLSAKRDKGTHPKSATYTDNYVATSSGEAVYSPDSSRRLHIVRRGETLAGIAKRERLSFLALYDVNREILKNNPDRLREGMKVWIPEHK